MNQDDLIEFLDRHNVQHREKGQHHHTTAGWVQVDCPYCSPKENAFRLGLSSRSANCWRCGKKNLVRALMMLTGQPGAECFKFVDFKGNFKTSEDNLGGRLIMPDGVGPMEKAHKNYLASQVDTPNKITKLWGLKGIGRAKKLAWRIWIPIHFNSKIVSWTTRAIGNGAGLRYISASPEQEALLHKNLLYGEDLAEHVIIIVEGPKDVWRIGPGAVATFGTSYSPWQVRRASLFPVRYVCYDNEPFAQKQADQLCKELSLFPGETRKLILDAKDPGSASTREINQLRKLLV